MAQISELLGRNIELIKAELKKEYGPQAKIGSVTKPDPSISITLRKPGSPDGQISYFTTFNLTQGTTYKCIIAEGSSTGKKLFEDDIQLDDNFVKNTTQFIKTSLSAAQT